MINIVQWNFGYMTIVGLLFFPSFYLLFRQLRRFSAWANREDPPRERAGVYVVGFAIFGAFLGGLSQAYVDTGVACYNQGQNIIQCMFNQLA